MTRAFTRKTLAMAAVAASIGCSLIYDTERLSDGEGANERGKPSGGFSGSAGSGGQTSVAGKTSTSGGASSAGTTSGGMGGTGITPVGASGGVAGTSPPSDAGSAGEAAGGVDNGAGAAPSNCSQTFYPDDDGDGWGDEAKPGVECETPGYAPGGDCADDDPFNNPGNPEYCDGVENDCNPATPDSCPGDCVAASYGDHRYLFCVGYSSRPDARARCALNGMRLVRLDDAEEQVWVNGWHQQEPAQHSWTGGSDAETPGTWKWEDGDVFRDDGTNMGYSDWAAGEPNNYQDSEHCLLLDNGQYWNDYNCSAPFEFTCERY